MKKTIFLKLTYLIFLPIIILNSCKKDEINTLTTNSNENLIEYGGLQVKLPKNYNEAILSYSLSDLQNQYFSIKTQNNLKSTNTDDIDISLEEMDFLITEILKKYPNTDSLSEDDIIFIQNDFNGLNEQEIYENINVIDSFYNAKIRYEYVNTLALYHPSLFKSSNDYLGYDVSKAEFWALVWHPRLVNPTRDATDKAIELTGQYFPNQDAWRTKADAFRHAIWNALIAKYVGDKKNTIKECVDWAKTFTDKHEEGGEKPAEMSQSDYDFDKEMDYHNNKIGRDYFKTVAWVDKRKWYQSSVIKAPSETTMADAILLKIGVAKKVITISQISLYPSNLVYIK